MWSQMLLSTHAFLKSISNVSGKDIGPLIKQWVYPLSQSDLCLQMEAGMVEVAVLETVNKKENNQIWKAYSSIMWNWLQSNKNIQILSLYPLGLTPPWRVLVLTVHMQRSEQCGEILRQFCLQQKEERAGAGDPSGLHIIWNSEICGESYSPVPCHSVRTQAGLNCRTFFATFFALFPCRVQSRWPYKSWTAPSTTCCR